MGKGTDSVVICIYNHIYLNLLIQRWGMNITYVDMNKKMLAMIDVP